MTLAIASGALDARTAQWIVHAPSVLCYTCNATSSSKVAALDLDGTLVKWLPGRRYSLKADSWTWLKPSVPAQLQAWVQSGYHLVLFTNQALIRQVPGGQQQREFQAKVDSILGAAGLSATVMVATLKDSNRKPHKGMWALFESQYNDDIAVDMQQSFYVGDAAGRPADHSADDRLFAQAVGLPFYLPEQVFRWIDWRRR